MEQSTQDKIKKIKRNYRMGAIDEGEQRMQIADVIARDPTACGGNLDVALTLADKEISNEDSR